MKWRISGLAAFVLAALSTLAGTADEPKPIPVTRPAMKEALDRLKFREPRLPFPAQTEEEGADGERRRVNNGFMRSLYLPEELRGGRGGSRGTRGTGQGGTRQPESDTGLDYAFSVELFWITSRVNNCHYCLGHQENKLLSAGVSEDRIAALDGRWEDFSPAEQAAFAYCRKLTYEPHLIGDIDIAALRKFYSPKQILEMTLLVSRYNATNRWTDSLGIPTEEFRTFTTETSEPFRNLKSSVAPFDANGGSAQAAPAAAADRGKLETREETEDALAACAERKPRLPVAEESDARAALPEDWPEGALPQWVRLATGFPRTGAGWCASYEAARKHGRLTPELKAQIAWVAARHDRAWYAVGQAKKRLEALGYSADDIYALDAPGDRFSEGERAAIAFTAKLTAAPQLIDDDDIASLRAHYSDPEVAEIVYHVTLAAGFDRLTEAAGLPLER